MSTLRANDIIPINEGSENYGLGRMWIDMYGGIWQSGGTVSINRSKNVSSLVDSGVGMYTINIDSAIKDVNYICGYSGQRNNANNIPEYTVTSGIIYAGTQSLMVTSQDNNNNGFHDAHQLTLMLVR